MDSIVLEIDHPHLRHLVPGVKGHFHIEIKAKRGVTDLNYQQRVGGQRMTRLVEVLPWQYNS